MGAVEGEALRCCYHAIGGGSVRDVLRANGVPLGGRA
jgi:hypothetical protein